MKNTSGVSLADPSTEVISMIIGFDAQFLDFSSPELTIIGAGVRANPQYFLLFERLLNVVHEFARPRLVGFNTKPTDTVDAVQRWL